MKFLCNQEKIWNIGILTFSKETVFSQNIKLILVKENQD